MHEEEGFMSKRMGPLKDALCEESGIGKLCKSILVLIVYTNLLERGLNGHRTAQMSYKLFNDEKTDNHS